MKIILYLTLFNTFRCWLLMNYAFQEVHPPWNLGWT